MIPTRDIPQRPAIIILIGILVLAAWMRLDGLGQFSFWTDEMYHVIAAQSLIECGEPVVPGRGNYWRAFGVTGMTAVSFVTFGVSEWSARIPFALISLVMLGIAYKLIATRFTRTLALITTGLIAFTPQFLQVGRECRMYAPFVLLYFLGVFAAYYVTEASTDWIKSHRGKTALALIAAVLLFVLAASLQYLAVSIGFTVAAYSVVMIAYLVIYKGVGHAVRSRYTLMIGLMCAVALGCIVITPSVAASLLELLQTRMEWDTRGQPASFSLWLFRYYYPSLWYLYPVGAVILIYRYGRLGLFMVCAFLPVLLAHMYLYTSRIAERYLIYILPFFFLVSATVGEALLWGLIGWVNELRRKGSRATAYAAICCAIPATWIFIHPWLGYSLELRRYGMGPDWKQIAPEIKEACENGIVIANWPREVLYYGGRFPDFFATQSYENFDETERVETIGEREVVVHYLRDAEALGRAIESGEKVYFVTTDWAYHNDAFLSDPIRGIIQESMTEIASVSSGNDRIMIYQSK